MSCGVSRKYGLDLALLWLWYRPVATVLIGPLAWESAYARGAAIKRKKKKSGLGQSTSPLRVSISTSVKWKWEN